MKIHALYLILLLLVVSCSNESNESTALKSDATSKLCECSSLLEGTFASIAQHPEQEKILLEVAKEAIPEYDTCESIILNAIGDIDTTGLSLLSIDERFSELTVQLNAKEICESWHKLVKTTMDAGKSNLEQIKSDTKWETKFYVDDFDDPTEQGYITRTISGGAFSNSATTNANLTVKLLVEEDVFDIILLEYDSQKVKNSSSRPDKYKVRIKNGDTKYEYDAENYGDRITFNKKDANEIIQLVQNSEKLKFVIIEISDYTKSTYKFSLLFGAGLKDELNKI